MVELDDEKVFYAFDKTLEPAMVVPSGTTVRVRTKDCFGNQIQKPEDELDGIDWDHTNPATGPIFVEGAVPGGALKVSVGAIEFDNKSVSCTGENEGVCGDRFNAWSTQVCEIDGDELVWDERLRIPLRPMIGVIGVAPEGDPINCGTPGSHGGNMDNTAITAGATLYFPVFADGALFGCGIIRTRIDGMIDCSPFGCRTGFHMIMWGQHSSTEIAKVIKASLEEIAEATTWEDVPGTTIESCGNYKDHSLFSAKEWCKLVLEKGISDDAFERHLV